MLRHTLGGLLLLSLILSFGRPAAATEVVLTGTFVINANISAVTTVPAGGQVWCHVRFTSAFNSQLFEDVNVPAVQGTGSNYSCRLSAPFRWDYGNFVSGSPNLSVNAIFLASIVTTNTSSAAPSLINSSLTFIRASQHFSPTPMNAANATVTFPTIAIRL